MHRSIPAASVMLAVLAAALAVPARPVNGQAVDRVPTRTERGLYLLKVVEPGYDITVTEVERGGQHSTVDMIGVVPTVTAGGTVMFKAIYDIAVERGFEYTFTTSRPLPPSDAAPLPEKGRYTSLRVKIFFTHDANVALKDLLGDEYDERAQRLFDQTGYQSVTRLKVLFGGR
jgi:hypothetical protein